MERKTEIQYIRYYTEGSAARKLELIPAKKEKPVQKKQRAKVRKIYIDPLPVAGILLSCVLLICMIVGMTELTALRESRDQLQMYVDYLQEEHDDLDKEFQKELDIEEIEQEALAMGMIPREQAQCVTVTMPRHAQAEETGFWQNVAHFLAGLFA